MLRLVTPDSHAAGTIVHRAAWVIADPWHIYRNGYVQVTSGQIDSVGSGPGPRRDKRIDHGEGVLAPVLVNAHTHLELCALDGKVPVQNGFQQWVVDLLHQRAALTDAQITAGIRNGQQRLMETGCAVVGEISTLDLSWRLLMESGLSGIYFREILGSLPPEPASCRPPRGRFQGSLAAHAPHTTAPMVLKAIKGATSGRGLPMSIHLAESDAETEFITTAGGPWGQFLSSRGIDYSDWQLPAPSPVYHLDRLGILDGRTLVVHLLQAGQEEFELLAKRGVSTCICPRSNHNLHQRIPNLMGMRRAGLNVCLGTDSLASVTSLSLWDEMHLVERHFPDLSPKEILGMATLNGAFALGLSDRFGSLTPGRRAAMMFIPLRASGPEALLEKMIHLEEF